MDISISWALLGSLGCAYLDGNFDDDVLGLCQRTLRICRSVGLTENVFALFLRAVNIILVNKENYGLFNNLRSQQFNLATALVNLCSDIIITPAASGFQRDVLLRTILQGQQHVQLHFFNRCYPQIINCSKVALYNRDDCEPTTLHCVEITLLQLLVPDNFNLFIVSVHDQFYSCCHHKPYFHMYYISLQQESVFRTSLESTTQALRFLYTALEENESGSLDYYRSGGELR
jgi:hypothetical protein